MTPAKVNEVLDKYELLCDILELDAIPHIQSMIPKIRVFLDEGRIEKAMRWLGFIQGILWTHDVYSLEALKSHNRSDQ